MTALGTSGWGAEENQQQRRSIQRNRKTSVLDNRRKYFKEEVIIRPSAPDRLMKMKRKN